MLMKTVEITEDSMTYGGVNAVQTVGNYAPFLYAGLILITIGLLSYSYWKRKN